MRDVVEQQARDREHLQVRRAGLEREAAALEDGVLRVERERDEGEEPTGLVLLVAQAQQVVDPLVVGLDVTEEHREAFGLTEARGALVQDVTEGKPADKAGIRHGDVVVEVNGKPIRTNRELIDTISYLPIGSEVKITVLRDGKRVNLTAKTEERPSDGTDDEDESSAAEPVHDKLGMTVNELSSDLRRQYGLPEDVRGVIVTGVKNVSPAGEANISEGDVISEIQGQRVTTLSEFRSAIDRLRGGQRIRMYVTTPTGRGGRPISTYRILTVP